MALEMDMIPGQYRKQRGLKRLLRHFMLTCAGVVVCIGLGRALLFYQSGRESRQLALLEQQAQLVQQNTLKTQNIRQQKQVTEQQLAELDKLRGSDRVALLLRAIDQAHSEGVWLDSVRFVRHTAPATPVQVPGAARNGITVLPNDTAANSALAIRQGAELVGHAVNHSRLAELMRQLGAQPSVADLRLIDTGTRNYTALQVVDFNLALQIHEKAQVLP